MQEAFGIPAETYYDWKEKLENGFNFGIKAKGERRRKIDKAALEQAVKENPDAFLWELAEQFNCTPTARSGDTDSLISSMSKEINNFADTMSELINTMSEQSRESHTITSALRSVREHSEAVKTGYADVLAETRRLQNDINNLASISSEDMIINPVEFKSTTSP